MSYSLVLERAMKKRTGDDKIEDQIKYILTRAFDAGRGRTWQYSVNKYPPVQINGNWVFKVKFNFTKTSGQRNNESEFNQWQNIKAMIQQTGEAQRFQPCVWRITEEQNSGLVNTTTNVEIIPEPEPETISIEPAGFSEIITNINKGIVRDIHLLNNAKKWNDLKIPEELLGIESDKHIANHPAFSNLYGVNPQIRIILSNIKRAQETNGESRNHVVMFGPTAVGKTTTLKSLEKMFGSDAVLKLDATSTTKAGLEKLFFNDLSEIPPLVFMEEAEKADPEALKIWLGALDDRGEIRKINFRVTQLKQIQILFICTINNKAVFDKMMNDGSGAGALSSRCVTQVYYPRPSQSILRQIVTKEICEKGGKSSWIDPVLKLAEELEVNDPRIVKSYLSGGDRLLDGSYQRDWKTNHEAQKAYHK